MMFWHLGLGHLLHKRMMAMAKAGDIPRRFMQDPMPECAACCFCKAMKVPWRTKGHDQRKIRTVTQPGKCVSVNQLESLVPGLIAQLKGQLTRARYQYATVFVDHYSYLTYIHLMQTLTREETIVAKRAFESYARQRGVTMRHYHANKMPSYNMR